MGWKIPMTVATGIICFVMGAALGVIGGAATADLWTTPFPRVPGMGQPGEPPEPAPGQEQGGGKAKGMGKGMGKAKGMGKGKGKGGDGGGGGGGGPVAMSGSADNPKNQLASLVAKLDQLTQKPLTISLPEEKRAKLREQLQGLEKEETLTEGDAKKRLDAILEIVKGDKETLEAAGYHWPGQRGGGQPSGGPNPFTSETNGKHLKSLQEQVAKGKGT